MKKTKIDERLREILQEENQEDKEREDIDKGFRRKAVAEWFRWSAWGWTDVYAWV